MKDIPHSDLLSEIRAFCGHQGMSPSAFGEAAVKDRNFVFELEAGRECRRATVRRVRDFIVSASEDAA